LARISASNRFVDASAVSADLLAPSQAGQKKEVTGRPVTS
jgi:hypothetical protein